MKRKYCAFMLMLGLFLGLMPGGAQAAYAPPASFGAPENVGVMFDAESWNFDVGYGASKEIRDILQDEYDGSFEDAGFYNLGIGVQIDYKLDDGQWRSAMVGLDELYTGSAWFSVEEGKFTDTAELRYYEFEDFFPGGELPGGKTYFNSHKMHFRLRFCVNYGDEEDDYEYISPWSKIVSYSNQEVEDPDKLINHAPVLKSAELRTYDDGEPYLFLIAENTHADVIKLNSISGGEVQTNVWIKVGTGQWKDNGTYGVGLEGFEVDINDYFSGGATSFDSFVYDVKFRYEFNYDNYPAAGKTGTIYSPFSNIYSHGMPAYSAASSWATPELDKADKYGLIPDILKGADMTKPITREEFAELAVLLYEKASGKTAWPVSPNPFTDTSNPRILKAFATGITAGTSATTFSPNVLINREQCATMLYRTIKAIAPNADYSVAGVADFPDQKHISSWAVEGTKYMFKLGIIKGDASGSFMPKATTTAQQAANYGMATREAAVLMTVRTYDSMDDISATKQVPESKSGSSTALPEEYPSDLIPIYKNGKIVSVEKKAFDTGNEGYVITIDYEGEKFSEVNGHYCALMLNAENYDGMVGIKSHYYGNKGGYRIEIDATQHFPDQYSCTVVIAYYKTN